MISFHRALRLITEFGDVDLLLSYLCDFTDPRMATLVGYKWNGDVEALIKHLLREDLVTLRAMAQVRRIGRRVMHLMQDHDRRYGPDLAKRISDLMLNPN